MNEKNILGIKFVCNKLIFISHVHRVLIKSVYQLIKHHIIIRRGFIDIKSLRVFDRSMGL